MLYVLSLGGSIVSLESGINTPFLKKFKKLIEERAKQGDRFIIVVGGGFTARHYIKELKSVNSKVDLVDKDYLGIRATHLNAFLLKLIFSDLSYPQLISDPFIKINTKKALIFSGGYKPGNSSDLVAVYLAETYKAKRILNLSNIDYVYDSDPRKNSTAKKIKNLKWKEFLNIVGSDWKPGMNAPFDPIASKRCWQKKKEVVVLDGRDIKNLANYFLGKQFRGTTIV